MFYRIIKNKIRQHTDITDDIFIGIFEFFIDNAYCCFYGKFYQQIFGTPMDSPLSGVIPVLVVEKLETDVLREISKI